jgi:hypothetical protein
VLVFRRVAVVKRAGGWAGAAGLAAIIRNPAVLEYALKGINAAGKAAVPLASSGAASIATDKDQQDNEKEQGTPISQNENTNGWLPIQTSDGQKLRIHPEDLDEAKKRDPNLKILD